MTEFLVGPPTDSGPLLSRDISNEGASTSSNLFYTQCLPVCGACSTRATPLTFRAHLCLCLRTRFLVTYLEEVNQQAYYRQPGSGSSIAKTNLGPERNNSFTHLLTPLTSRKKKKKCVQYRSAILLDHLRSRASPSPATFIKARKSSLHRVLA